MSQKKSTTTQLRVVPAPSKSKKRGKVNLERLLPKYAVDESHNLCDHLLWNPKTSVAFQVNVEGRPVSEFIHDGDLVIADYSLNPRTGDVVLHRKNGALRFDKFKASYAVVAVATATIHLLREGGTRLNG